MRERAEAMLDAMRAAWPGVAVAGGVGIGVAASGVEYFDEPGAGADAVRPAAQPASRCFMAARRWGVTMPGRRWCMPTRPPTTWPTLIDELSERLSSRYLFGGLASLAHAAR